MHWQTSRFLIDLARPQVMGIVNVTPDSFSDGGLYASTTLALRHAERLLAAGADLLDIGGESSRPGAATLPLAEELARVLPVVREAVRLGVPISVDTYKPAVMQAVLDLGADIINDIWAMRWAAPPDWAAGASQVVARHPRCGVCLMHMHGNPTNMQTAPMQGDAVASVRDFLRQAAQDLGAQGVPQNRIVLDPGIGFGKTPAQNFALLGQQSQLLQLGYPLLVGWSRKSSLAHVSGAAPANAPPERAANHPRMAASVAAALLAVQQGAAVVRVHDVAETVQALGVWSASGLQPASHHERGFGA
jgi:dihydropteroate synthase